MSWLSTGVRRGSAGLSGDNRLAARPVGQGAAVGTAAELPRTTSCTGYGAGLATSSPRTKARTGAPTACPRSRRGWATVVSGGSAEWAGGESSNPTTDSRSGAEMPAPWAARRVPRASWSLKHRQHGEPAVTEPDQVTDSGAGAARVVDAHQRHARQYRLVQHD